MAAEQHDRVLVVDDDPIIRETMAAALGDEGYAVKVAGDGHQALATLREWRPDLIVLDLMMPVMDGFAFRSAQRGVDGCSDIPVVVLSAAHNVRSRVGELAPAAVFPKPFDLDEVLDTIGRLLNGPGAS